MGEQRPALPAPGLGLAGLMDSGVPFYFGDALPNPYLLNSEGQDLAILPDRYPGLPALV